MESCLVNPNQKRHSVGSYEILNDDGPVVTKISNMVLPDEADYLIKKAEEVGLARSTVVTEKDSKEDDSRTSYTAFLPKGSDDVITCIENRLSAIAGKPHSHLEPLQVTKYNHTQKYDPHHDWFDKSGENQRTTTIFTYIKGLENDGGEKCGGATVFPKISDKNKDVLRCYPVTGNAVMWSNLNTKGEGEEMTLHGGEPVLCDNTTKIGLNAWFTEKKWGH